MMNFDDAAALFEQSKDPFYLAAFMLQCWLGELMHRTAAEYAEKKNPRDRALQTGEAWRSLSEYFHLPGSASQHFSVSAFQKDLLSHFCRFAASDDSPGNLLRRSLVPLSIEHYHTGEHPVSASQDFSVSAFPEDAPTSPRPLDGRGIKGEGESPFSPLRVLVRWCDWLDAAIHLQTHRRWHLSPACFDPDPEKRYLAALGNAQRHLAKLSDRARSCWLSDFLTAAAAFKDSPKWATVGRAMAAAPSPTGRGLGEGVPSGPLWTYEHIDTLVIPLWPLVKAHNWTYRDLMFTVTAFLPRGGQPNSGLRPPISELQSPDSDHYPCSREQDFAGYCRNILGLRKIGKGKSAKNGRPTGCEIAQKLCGL